MRGGDVCPLAAMEVYQKHFQHRFENEPHLPLCRRSDGSPLHRAQIVALLEKAAVATGLPPDRFRSHSLRIGGATALYHIYHDVEVIKRYGRWRSAAFQDYLWEGRETSQGVAAKMASDDTTVHVGQEGRPTVR